jgi:DNA-binding MarR family transcriptional regulator
MARSRRTPPPAEPRGVIGQIARIREQANLLIEEELAARGAAGLAPAHGAVMGFLFRQTEAVPIKDLVAAVGRAKSTVTGIVQTLERHGYVERLGDPGDSRVCAVRLTARGRGLRAGFEEISGRLLDAVYGDMPQRDRETLVRLLAELERNLAVWRRE